MKQKNHPKLFEYPTLREQEVIDLYNQYRNNPNTQHLSAEKIAIFIAKDLNISVSSAKTYISKLRNKGFMPKPHQISYKSIDGVRITKADSKMTSKIETDIQSFIDSHSQYYDNNTSKKIANYDQFKKIVAIEGFNKKDVHLLMNIFVERGLYEEAVNLLYKYEQAHELSDQESKKISALKHRLRVELLRTFTDDVPDYVSNPDDSIIGNER